jgi:membrane protease YdiL (CAAX protease family)
MSDISTNEDSPGPGHETTARRLAPPLHFTQALLIFTATSLVFFGFLYVLLPFLRQHDFSWFACFNLTLAAPMFLLVALALTAYAREGAPLRWDAFRERYRLSSMDLSSWIWTLALATFMFGGSYANLISFIVVLIALCFDRTRNRNHKLRAALGITLFLALTWLIWQTRPFFSGIILHTLPISLREFLAHLTDSRSFMGIPLHHRWWIAVYYGFVLLFGNIAGEELWWRGYLLPRQEAADGRLAWLYHGLLWAAFHLFLQTTAWDLLHMVPTCCALAFVASYRRNTWPGIIAHTVGNSGILIGIVHGIAN